MQEFLDDFPWLVPLALFGGFYYLLTPLLVRMKQRFPARPQLKELDLDRLDEDLDEFLSSRTMILTTLGFKERTLVRIPQTAPNVSAYLVMMVNRPAGDKVMVTVLIGHGPIPIENLYVEFNTRFEDGRTFNTLNSTELNAFPPRHLATRTQVPSVVDPEELYELHHFVMDKHNARGNKVVYPAGEALAYLRDTVFAASYEEQAKRGWMYYHEASDTYRTTLKGAYLIVWGLLQPMKAIRRWALRRRERRILAEFDRAAERDD